MEKVTCAERPSEFAVSDSKSGRSRDVKRPRRILTDHPFSEPFGVQVAAGSMLRGKDQTLQLEFLLYSSYLIVILCQYRAWQ